MHDEIQKPQTINSDPLRPEQQQLFITLAHRFQEKGLIKSLLIASGIHQKEIAKRYGFDPSDVSKVIMGTRKTRSIRKAIAEELGLQIHELWSK